MFGRMIKIAALAGVGTMAYRWWQNKQAEDREYASGEMRNPGRSNMTSSTGATGGVGSSTSGMGSSTGGFGSSGAGTTSPIGSRADQIPAQ